MVKNYVNLERVLREIETINSDGYGAWPLPCSLDSEISGLINNFLTSEPVEQQAIIGKVMKPFLFLAFSERMAILGVREISKNRLFEGLIAHVIEGFSYDPRENLLILSLLDHSASKIGLNPSDLFKEAAVFATPEAANYMLEYTHRKPRERKIGLMGYKEIMTPEGFSYQRTW